jgi:hypothetical protein
MVKFQPDGWHTVTPRIVVPDPAIAADATPLEEPADMPRAMVRDA